MKKQMDMENLLRWAFVQELTKGDRVGEVAGSTSNGWGKIMGFAQLGTLIQSSGQGGTGYVERHEIHRDAKLIGEAVRELAGLELGGWEEWDAFEDVPQWAEHLQDVPARMVARFAAMPERSRAELPVTLVVTAAKLGRRPSWQWDDVPTLRMVEVAGRPAWFVSEKRGAVTVEVDGFDPRKGRPKPGAFRKFTVSPDPFAVALARADWQIWVRCLQYLDEQLDGALADWDVAPCDLPLSPWVTGEAPERAAARVLEPV